MKHILLITTLILGTKGVAQANGLDISGRVSMGLQATTTDGQTEIEPAARLEGTVSYTMETDIGVTFVLALEFDESLAPRSVDQFLPRHR